ncbi:MAG TPA: winged helix-turn-helix domain-containing protein, partial [Candidatus Sulfomarinibacteraceae bacterium]|nr:winged helix-turn-helix domain-containing protein [Candidatus Sulfomarinibacteraceae bacterium]
MAGPRHDFRLGDRLVRPLANEVEGPDGIERVGPRAMDVLVALADRGDGVVTKEELLDAVWTDLFVGDEVLSTAVWELRRALGDDAKSPRFIGTVPRRGYRLLIPPSRIDGDDVAPAPTEALPGASTGEATAPRRRRAVVFAVAAALAVVTAVAVGRWLTGPAPAAEVRSMVVLPFASLSGDPRDEALADGVTDTLITSLAKIEGLQVVSATTARSYRGRTIPVPEVGRELGVDAVIEGSLARDGDRIVLNAQLIDARSDSHLWAETYERRFEHLLDLQVEVARSIGAAIGHRFAPTP